MEHKLKMTKERLLMECEISTGLTQSELQIAMPQVSIDELVFVINALLRENKLKVLQDSREIYYKTVDLAEYEKIKNLDAKQLVVYRLVEQEGSDGIWKKTLRERSCIARVDFEKIVKGLESKRIIKRFKSVTAKNKIFYILGTLDPDTQHTGGIFFTTSHDLDVEFIEIVSKYCYTYIQQRGSASVSEITMYISTSGIATVQIPREDIQKLLYTLELDAKIESFIPTSIKRDMTPFSLANVDPEIHYRPTRLQIKANGLTNTPCGTCPVIEKCYPGADINPINCIYLEKWLDF